MREVHLERMQKLADHLRGLDARRFNFCMAHVSETNFCGTIGCAIGHTPELFPDLVELVPFHKQADLVDSLVTWKGGWPDTEMSLPAYVHVASNLFGLSPIVAGYLFTPERQSFVGIAGAMGVLPNCATNCQPAQVAAMLELFMRYVRNGQCNDVPYET